MKLFFDYGRLLFNYDFNRTTLARAHRLALGELGERGVKVDFSQLSKAHDVAIDDYLRARCVDFTEWSMRRIMEGVLRNLGIRDPHLASRLDEIYKLNDHDSYPREGILELIPELAEDFSLNIISNLPHNSAVSELQRYGVLPCFDTITFSYEAGHRKPHPSIYNLAVKRAKADLRDSLFLSHEREEVVGAMRTGLDSRLVFTADEVREALPHEVALYQY